MALTPGTRLGHYDVTSLLGEGGMGQVWRNRYQGRFVRSRLGETMHINLNAAGVVGAVVITLVFLGAMILSSTIF